MLTRINRNSLILILSAFALYFGTHFRDSGAPEPPLDKLTLNTMPGTWSAPAGPEGNQISFVWTKIKDKPGDPIAMVVSAYETSGRIKNLLGVTDIPFTFGYRSHAPEVVIFVNLDKDQAILKLKASDHNHMSLQRLSKHYATQEKDLTAAPTEPAINLVREAEPAMRLPDYK